MKKQIVLFCGLLLSTATFAQTIPNSSFESWVQYSAAGSRPEFWTTTDSITMGLSSNTVHSALQDLDASNGTYAVKLISSEVIVPFFGTVRGPGVLTNGVISASLTSYSISGGTATAVRSKFFNAEIKYLPDASTDAAVITAALLRRNTLTGNRDTIAIVSDTIDQPLSTYTPVALQFDYRDWVNNPDSCLILIQSSRGINDPNLALGSALFVDNLSFSGTIGVDDISATVKQFDVFPSPASSYVRVRASFTDKKSGVLVRVLDTNGKLVAEKELDDAELSFDVNDLSAGNYLMQLIDNQQRHLATRQFSVAR